jgi:hypothetical protein
MPTRLCRLFLIINDAMAETKAIGAGNNTPYTHKFVFSTTNKRKNHSAAKADSVNDIFASLLARYIDFN